MYRFRTCGFCGRAHNNSSEDFSPPLYCNECSSKRRNIAISIFGSRPVQDHDFTGDYLLPQPVRIQRILSKN